ncbi:hypothetical protein ZWY2020_002760 [Hordeum vulgare]|nr:hypothetical protein ZWY2020_013999 [Hordeum vulgare]KAI4971846.1 hypothetical protein ZWY2020_002760 [Hordeum vulgare]
MTTLNEKKMKIAANAEDIKMLTLNVESLDADTKMIMQSIRFKMLQRQIDQLIVADTEDGAERDVEVEAAYAPLTTP